MEGTIATIMMFAGNFAPKTWAFCDGSTINIASNTALFSLIGTTYGGNGTSNFALPNLKGRMPVGSGQGPGLSDYSLGQAGGSNSFTLSSSQMPVHSHPSPTITIGTSESNANLEFAIGNALAIPPQGNAYAGVTSGNAAYGSFQAQLSPVGSSVPVGIQQPITTVNMVICVYGVFPSRN
jgi:microcystin-dependent protein